MSQNCECENNAATVNLPVTSINLCGMSLGVDASVFIIEYTCTDL